MQRKVAEAMVHGQSVEALPELLCPDVELRPEIGLFDNVVDVK